MKPTAIRLTTALAALLWTATAHAAEAGTIGPENEMQTASAWVQALCVPGTIEEARAKTSMLPAKHVPPFSFVYGLQQSADLLPQWSHAVRSRALDDQRTQTVATWADPKTGLQVQVEATVYRDFPAVEWVLYFKNAGESDTPILENILPLDAGLSVSGQAGDPTLHYANGALCSIDDFAPVRKDLAAGSRVDLQPGGGRSSSEVLPFFNLDLGSRGVVTAIGWTGEWAATFSRDEASQLELRAGMASTHLKLHPGEQIRTPRILTLFWQGEPIRGNNLLRRFLLAHHRPRPNGKPLVLPVLVGGWGGTAAADHLKTIERIVQHDLPIELYWIDAEWFGRTPWFQHVGNWEVRRDLYPQGFKPISDRLHQASRRFLLWFEPHRICEGTPWHELKDRPNWLLALSTGDPRYQQRNMNWGIPHDDPRWVQYESRRSQITEGDLLFNLAEPEARRFLTDFVAARIEEFGLDWYREDFNIAPLEYWQHADAPDRRGMAEIRFIEGLYAMWDELLERYPRLAIDNCASGGRRIDLETVGRSTALWRTDWPADAIHKQCHTFGLLSWVPLNMSGGALLKKGNEYEIRSSMTAGLNVLLDGDDSEESVREARKLLDQYLGIQKFFHGDYYPLTEYSQAPDAWMAYQLDLPAEGEGVVVVLKRHASTEPSRTFPLQGIDQSASYRITSLDTAQSRVVPGAALVQSGLEVQLPGQPDSALIRYTRVAE